MFDQLKSSINGMDIPEEQKSKLVSMVSNVETSTNERFNDVKDSRDATKSKLKEIENKHQSLMSKLNLNEDYGDDDVQNLLQSSNADIEKVKADFEARYNTDTKSLNDKIAEVESRYSELETKHKNAMFDNEIRNSGFLSKYFIDDPMAQTNILNLIKEKTIQQDGKIYARDNITGEILKDINNNNEPLGLEYVVNEIKSTLNPIYLKTQSNVQGGNIPPNQSNGHSNKGNKVSDYTIAELRAMKETNPQQYASLEKNK